MFCHTEIELADQSSHFTLSQHTEAGPTSDSSDAVTPGAWQGATAIPVFSGWYDLTWKKPYKESRDRTQVCFF